MRTSNLSSRNRQAVSKRLKQPRTAKIIPLEDDEAKVFHRWLEIQKIPHAHIANESNGGSQSARIRGAKMKAMGQSKGVWDYEIFLPIKGITGNIDAYQEIRVELKRQKGGVVSQEQKAWGRIYEKAGIPCRVCKGANEAIKFIEEIKEEICSK